MEVIILCWIYLTSSEYLGFGYLCCSLDLGGFQFLWHEIDFLWRFSSLCLLGYSLCSYVIVELCPIIPVFFPSSLVINFSFFLTVWIILKFVFLSSEILYSVWSNLLMVSTEFLFFSYFILHLQDLWVFLFKDVFLLNLSSTICIVFLISWDYLCSLVFEFY